MKNTISQVFGEFRAVAATQNYMSFHQLAPRLREAISLSEKGYPVNTDIDELKRKYEGDLSLVPDAESEIESQLQEANEMKKDALKRLKEGQAALQASEDKRKSLDNELSETKKALTTAQELNDKLREENQALKKSLAGDDKKEDDSKKEAKK